VRGLRYGRFSHPYKWVLCGKSGENLLMGMSFVPTYLAEAKTCGEK